MMDSMESPSGSETVTESSSGTTVNGSYAHCRRPFSTLHQLSSLSLVVTKSTICRCLDLHYPFSKYKLHLLNEMRIQCEPLSKQCNMFEFRSVRSASQWKCVFVVVRLSTSRSSIVLKKPKFLIFFRRFGLVIASTLIIRENMKYIILWVY